MRTPGPIAPQLARVLHTAAVCLIAAGWCAAARAQETPSAAAPAQDLATAEIQARINQIQSADPTPEQTAIIEAYTQALGFLQTRNEWRDKAAEFDRLRESAPTRLAEIQDQLLSPPEDPNPSEEIGDEESLAELELRLQEVETDLEQARAELAELSQEPARRAERQREIPGLQSTVRENRARAEEQLTALESSAEAPALVEARRTVQRARIASLDQEMEALTKEQQSYDARNRLLLARRDLATRKEATADRRHQALRAFVADRRRADAIRAAREMRAALFEANNAPESIRTFVEGLANENVALAEQRTGVIQEIETIDRQLQLRDDELLALNNEFAASSDRVEAAGNSDKIGVLLRNQRANLPEIPVLRAGIRLRSDTIAEVQLEQLERADQRRAVADIEGLVNEALDERVPNASDDQRDRLARLLRETYRTQHNALDALIADYANYYPKLVDLDARETEIIEVTREFRNFIDEHILWVQSGLPLGLRDARRLVDAAAWLAAPSNLIGLPRTLLDDFLAAPLAQILRFAFPLALLFGAPAIVGRLSAVGTEAAKSHCTDVRLTFAGAMLTLLHSAGPPLVIGIVGWRLTAAVFADSYARAVGQGLITAALLYWMLRLARTTLRPGGLALNHFGWPAEPIAKMFRMLRWYVPVTVSLVFLIATFEAATEMDFQDSAGRLAFVCVMFASAVLGYQLFRTRGGALLDAVDIWRGRGRLGVRRFWYFAATVTPFLLTVAACSGYYYSSVRLASRIYLTAVAAFLLLMAASVAMRWSLLARRRFAIEQAKRKLAAQRAEAVDGEQPREEPELDLDKVDAQTGRLVRSTFVIGLLISMWFIWAEFLPALSILNELQVWETQRETVVQRDIGDGQIETDTLIEIIPITWRDLVVALLIGIATFIAVQNIPGLLEIAVLQRLPLVAGERYAVQTIFSYSLVLVGVLWAINTIGIGWSQVQWLVAAVGLGLGFGLQEIFANFIAGIIILFEQPIRVGDTVTVGDISGKVSKIRIRATWITAFNRQELVVPNKEFVTNRLINWTLSDQVLRVDILVGIAYGSDTRAARKALLEAANQNELVLKDPAPDVFFTGFGDSSLNFELRVFSPSMEYFFRIRDQLHVAIDDVFRKANIEIAFPQRDIHVRSIQGELPVKQSPAPTEEG